MIDFSLFSQNCIIHEKNWKKQMWNTQDFVDFCEFIEANASRIS